VKRVALAALIGLAGARAAAEELEPLPAPLRLEQVVGIARSRRAEIAAARARARAAAARPAIVSALEDPMVFHSIDHLPFALDGVDFSFSVEQQFPLSRIRGHRGRAAQSEAERLRADAQRVELVVELDAAGAFLMLQERRETARVLAEQRALAQDFVTSALARFSAGTGEQADVLRAQIEVARLDGALRAIASEVHAAEAMLNTSLGRPSNAPVPALYAIDETAPLLPVEAARDSALARRPELAAGSAEVRRAQAEVSVMRSMYAPMAMVRTGPAYSMIEGAGWMLMVGITLPVQRGRLRAGVAEAEAMVQMSRADLEAMRRMVDGEAVGAREQAAAARERLLALRDQVVPKARQAIDPTLAGYAAGRLPLVSVIEAAEALWSAQAELIEAEFNLGLARARLERAMGNGGRS
jgi:outer membrane protein, heavy metal efflux system